MEREQGRKVATEEMWDYLSEGENKDATALESSIPKAVNGAPLLLAADGEEHKKLEKVNREPAAASVKRLYIVLIRSILLLKLNCQTQLWKRKLFSKVEKSTPC